MNKSPVMSSGSSGKRRATPAAQACETCRKRKSRCDQQRPRCTLCRRLNVECRYKDPPPVKKDETMVSILETVQRLEARFNSLDSVAAFGLSSRTVSGGESLSQHTPDSQYSSHAGSSTGRLPRPSISREQSRPYLTVPHKLLLWPSIRSQLISLGSGADSELEAMSELGTVWLIKQEVAKHPQGLHFDIGMSSLSSDVITDDSGVRLRVGERTLTGQQIQKYTDAYFNTFNLIYPILEYSRFRDDILKPVLVDALRFGDHASVIALLVFALGELAIEGISGSPTTDLRGSPGGVRGGTPEAPPGLSLFNEARVRLGSLALQCGLADVQVQLLQAAYFEANACHVEYWRSTVAASLACQVLVKCHGNQWSSPQGDFIKRVYWTCVTNEDSYHMALDLPRTEIYDFENDVPFPHFHEIGAQHRSTEGATSGPESQYYFLAFIALRNVISRIHDAIHLSSGHAESPEEYDGPPMHLMIEMARQLDSWHTFLPGPLQWLDRGMPVPSFGEAVNESSTELKCGLIILRAELQTRYYYARFILYRPLIFKALHFPELMTDQDAESCSHAIRAACLWAMAMAPTKGMKRLVPQLFTWTQNLIGVLLILWMSLDDERLNSVTVAQLDRGRIQQAITLLSEYLEDVKQIDGIAEWSWRILEPLLNHRPWMLQPSA